MNAASAITVIHVILLWGFLREQTPVRILQNFFASTLLIYYRKTKNYVCSYEFASRNAETYRLFSSWLVLIFQNIFVD